MSYIIPLTISEIIPTPKSVLRQMGVPKTAVNQDGMIWLAENAIELFLKYAKPSGMLLEIPKEEFALIYRGEGKNSQDTPLEHIYDKAEKLAVYALTLGNQVSKKINEKFESGDVALAAMLDATASVAANNCSVFSEKHFQTILLRKSPLSEICVLAYSPGYCGWHISGQKKLFQSLRPEKIEITLTDSCLMTPIKSVSGVLVAGNKEINHFRPEWDFCETCTTYSCLQRMKRLREIVQF